MVNKFSISVFGCQMNWSDAERIAALFESIGLKKTDKMECSDIAIVVMCSVRQMAANRIFGLEQKIKLAKQKNKNFIAILTGCVVESDKEYFSKIFDQILDIKELPQWPNILKSKIGRGKTPVNLNSAVGQTHAKLRGSDPRKSNEDYFNILPKHCSKFSALIPISKGCDNFCSYCVVPYTRGRLVSRPANDILREAKQAIANGAKEIWLLGQNVNNYHDQGVNFAKLLRMANDISGDFWIRFTSPHPKDFDDAAVLAMAECQKATPYLNLPIQSGDDAILKAMKRPYTAAQYKTLVKKIRAAFKKQRQGLEKEIAISTDVIVGFCGETKTQFQNTAKLFKEIKYDMAYISRYSRRAGTAAADMEDNVSDQEKKRREEILNDIVKITALAHNKKYIGKTVDVLVQTVKNNFALGKSRHYKTVKFPLGKHDIKAGDIIQANIVRVMPFGLFGKINSKVKS